MSRDKTNLLNETKEALLAAGKSPRDVMWVGVLNKNSVRGPKSFSWGLFAAVANIDYNAGFGGAEIALDLVIVGNNWWLERGEYDGSEWWEFKILPGRPDLQNPIAEDLMERW